MKRIHILFVENNISALNQVKKVLEKQKEFEIDVFQSSGKESTQLEITRRDQINTIEEKIGKFDYDILIMDLFLRDNTSMEKEQLLENLSGADKLISVEMAQKFKAQFREKGIFLVFTSSSNSCKTHEDFEMLRKQNPGVIPEESVFIFKPEEREFYWGNCPIYTRDNVTFCGEAKEDSKGCCSSTCFRRLVKKYYQDYLRRVRT